MFTIWFSEGGNRLAEREWPIVPRVGETVTLMIPPAYLRSFGCIGRNATRRLRSGSSRKLAIRHILTTGGCRGCSKLDRTGYFRRRGCGSYRAHMALPENAATQIAA